MTESLAFKSEVSSYELSLNNCITVGMFLKKGVIAKALQHLVKWKQLETPNLFITLHINPLRFQNPLKRSYCH